MRYLILCVILLSMTACASVDKVGHIGKWEVHKVATVGVIENSATSLVAYDNASGSLVPLHVTSGDSVAGNLVKAGAVVGGAAIMSNALSDMEMNAVIKP